MSEKYGISPFPILGNYENVAAHLAQDKSVALISTSDQLDTLQGYMACRIRYDDIHFESRWGSSTERREHERGWLGH